jgi:actin related protein 2/3 complex subunit 2
MLQLSSDNPLIRKTLTELLETPQLVDRIISDFDYTTYHLSTPQEKSQLLISITSKSFKDLSKYGVAEKLHSVYGEFEVGTVEPGYDYSIVLNLDEINSNSSAEEKEEIIDKISLLKRNLLSAPFELAFKEYEELALKHQESGVEPERSNKVLEISYRDEESIYIQPSFDRVTVIFSTVFKDETDKIFGKVFLQEFVDARRRAVQNAPQVLYSHREPPLEIKNLINFRPDDKKGYITFILFPRHLTVQKRENTISQIQLFRNYFHYHIKCSKAYLHSRMRFRVDQYLKILNRAKPESDEQVERKTATGRRFVA